MRSRFRVFWAILAVLVLYTGLQVGRLFPRSGPPGVWGLTVLVFWLILGWLFLHRSRPEALETRWFQPLAWIGSVALGIWATFILLSIPVDLEGVLRRLLGGGFTGTTPWVVAGLLLAALVLSGLGLRQALLGPAVREILIPIRGLPGALEGLRIAQISDLHVGPTIRAGYVESVARAVMGLGADLIAITGDLADGSAEALARHVAPLAGLSAPLGVYFVTGNHEYYWGAEAWLRKAGELGWTPLIDEGRLVERGGVKVLVAGVADSAGPLFLPAHRSDPRRAAEGGAGASLRILLAHRPDACFAAEPAGFDLQLSGHTHGGQFFPFSLLVRLVHRYYRGLNRHGRLWVYVNPGTGYWGPPHRFWVPAEITLLRLTAEESKVR